MRKEDAKDRASALFCPSAQPEMPDCRIIGIVAGTTQNPRISFLDQFLDPTEEILNLAHPVTPTEVFRFAAPCQGRKCSHFDGKECRLAPQIVQILPVVSPDGIACHLRAVCRWYQQEGNDACKRCPQIVTELYGPTDEQRKATEPWTSVKIGVSREKNSQ